MVRLTDSPDMTLDVYRGRKTTIQQQQHCHTLNDRFTQLCFLNIPHWDSGIVVHILLVVYHSQQVLSRQ